MDPIRVGVVGFWHVHANDYAREASGTRRRPSWRGGSRMPRSPRGRGGARNRTRGLPRRTARTARHRCGDGHDGNGSAHDVIRRAIRAGKHVFTEKLLAPTVAECESSPPRRVSAGVALVVSLPRLSERLRSLPATSSARGRSARSRTPACAWLTTVGSPAGCRIASPTLSWRSAARSATSAATPPTSCSSSSALVRRRSRPRTVPTPTIRSKTTPSSPRAIRTVHWA